MTIVLERDRFLLGLLRFLVDYVALVATAEALGGSQFISLSSPVNTL